ncbi:hypothetical protein CSUI_000460 [Cystoisospora suis]|uniref:Uncharacterized protein n=1 Tax=Cystoisospora suis TaxID=483139 RepID=A0A2C6LGU7_9APIC|nr:hypothetical protein CSUI_000460 [Cystoisospora suis]
MRIARFRKWSTLIHPRCWSWLSYHSLSLIARHSPFRFFCRQEPPYGKTVDEAVSREVFVPFDLNDPAAFGGLEISFVMGAEDTPRLPPGEVAVAGGCSNNQIFSAPLIANYSSAYGGEGRTADQQRPSNFFAPGSRYQPRPQQRPPASERVRLSFPPGAGALSSSEMKTNFSGVRSTILRHTAQSGVPATEKVPGFLIGRTKKKRKVRIFLPPFPHMAGSSRCRSAQIQPEVHLPSKVAGRSTLWLAEKRISVEAKARFLLSSHRSDASGLFDAVGEDRDVLLTVFSLAGVHRLRRCRWLLKPLKEKVIQDICKFEIDEIARLATSMHQVGYLRIDFLCAASSVIPEKIGQAAASSCVVLLEAFAVHRFVTELSITALCDALERSNEFGTLTPSELASVLSSLARLNSRREVLLTQVSNQLFNLWNTTVPAASPDNVREEAGQMPQYVISTKQAALPRARRYNSHDVAQALYGLTKLQWHAPELMRLLVGIAVPSVVARMHSHQLSLVAVALHRMQQPYLPNLKSEDFHDSCSGNFSAANLRLAATVQKDDEGEVLERRAFELVVNETWKRFPQFRIESVYLILRACAAYGVRDERLIARLVGNLPRLVLTFEPVDAVAFAEVFFSSGARSEAAVELLLDYAKQNLFRFSPPLLHRLLSSLSSQGRDVHSELLHHFDDSSLVQCNRGYPRHQEQLRFTAPVPT